jgi:biopolymer transport protein ExbD
LLLAVETGSFAVDGAPVLTLAGLDARLRAALETRRDRTVVVRVAAGVPYARVIDAVDTARGCGAVRVGLVDSTAERP